MQPLESIPESRLADVLMGELFPRQEIDDTFVDIVLDDLELGDPPETESDYFVYEIVRDAFATTEFVRVRDTRYDHIVTVEFPREFARELGADTAPIVKASEPYERIEIEHDAGESARIPMERISVERMTVEPVSFARASEQRISVAHGEIAATAADDEMQLELEDLEIEQDFFAKGDAAAFPLLEREELDDASVDVELDDQASGARFMSYAQALPFPLYSAPFERVELGELPAVPREIASEATDVIVPHRSTSTRVFATVFVIACAIAAAVGLALLVVRDARG